MVTIVEDHRVAGDIQNLLPTIFVQSCQEVSIFSFHNPFHLSITVITAIVNSRNFRELSAMFIFYLSDQTTKSQAMFLLKFLQISSVLYSVLHFCEVLLSFLRSS